MISIICPTYNEEKYIDQCIQSILQQDYPKDDLEIFFVDGNSNDKTQEIIKKYCVKYDFIHLLVNPYKIVPYAMNIGIKASKGEIIIRIDAHSLYSKNYFSTLVEYLKKLEADNVGAVCKTDVLHKTNKTLAIREVLTNKYGVGNSFFRTGINHVAQVDAVPFGCWKRSVFEKYGLFNTNLVRNQDIELSKRILRGGGKIYLVPDTYCTYFARETYKALAKNNFGNGKWTMLTVYYTRMFSSLSFRHFVPIIFLLSLIIPLLLGMIWCQFIFFSVALFFFYIGIIGVICGKLSLKKKLSFFHLLCSFLVLHFSYGWGSMSGLLKLPFLKK